MNAPDNMAVENEVPLNVCKSVFIETAKFVPLTATSTNWLQQPLENLAIFFVSWFSAPTTMHFAQRPQGWCGVGLLLLPAAPKIM